MTSLRHWLAAVWFAIVGPRLRARTIPHDLGARADHDQIPVITLRGTPYDRGFQHGYHCRNDLHRFRTTAWEYAPRTATERFGIPFWLAKLLIRPALFILSGRYIPLLSDDIHAEMQGLADGADLDIREVAVNTVIWEVFAMFPSKSASKPTHCSEVAFNPTVSTGSLLGYNYDMLVASDRTLVETFLALFVVEPIEGAHYVAPNTIGSIGINTGMNQHGVTFGWDNSYLRSDLPKGTNRTPYMLLLRELALQAQSLEEASQRLRQEERQEADISVIADTQQVGVVELAGTRSALRLGNAVWSCNRLQELIDLDYRGSGRSPDGRPTRYPEVVQEALSSGQVTPTAVAAIIRDTNTTHGRPIASEKTAFSAIYDIATRRVWVSFRGAPSSCERLYAFTADGRRIAQDDIV